MRYRKLKKRFISMLLAALMLLEIIDFDMIATATGISGGVNIVRWEKYNPVYDESAEAGTAWEDLSLPTSLRAVFDLSEFSLDASTFSQVEPTADTSDGYTSYDYYWYGYVKPYSDEVLAEMYANGELVIYSIYYADETGESVGEVGYRVYGTIGDYTEPCWFTCEEDGTLTGVVLDVPVEWSSDGYDGDTVGEYTVTGSADGYSYDTVPTAVIYIYESTEDEDEEEEETEGVTELDGDTSAEEVEAMISALLEEAEKEEEEKSEEELTCTCDLALNKYSSQHAEDCPYYDADLHCTCEVGEDEYSSEHDEDCPYYEEDEKEEEDEQGDCHCASDGGAINSDSNPWEHNVDCPYYSPVECMCREVITEEVEEEGEDGETYTTTITYYGDYTHVHDSSNTNCPLYGKDTVSFIKVDSGEVSVMSIEDACEIEEAQEEGEILYSTLGEIEVLWNTVEYLISTMSIADSTGTEDKKAVSAITNYCSSTGAINNIYTAGLTIPGTWRSYINTIWLNRYKEFDWTDASEITIKIATTEGTTYNYTGEWVWEGTTATNKNGDVTTDPKAIPSADDNGIWIVYSGEQLLYALTNCRSDQTVRLGTNINLNGSNYSWKPPSAVKYGITIDGNGYSIYNLGIYTTANNCWFVALSNSYTVKDIKFVTARLVSNYNGNGKVGIFNGAYQNSTSDAYTKSLENVEVIDSLFFSKLYLSMYSSVLGSLQYDESDDKNYSCVHVKNCYTEGNYIYGGNHVSSFAASVGSRTYTTLGQTDSYSLVEYCYSVDNLICGIGGHSAGFISCDGGDGVNIENCFADNEVYGSVAVAGFRGGIYGNTTNCYVTGKLEGYSRLAGFTWTWDSAYIQSGQASIICAREFTNCYSTVLVGLRTGGTYQGGFSVRGVSSSNYGMYDIYINCFAAGEVGNYDIDLTNNEATKDISGEDVDEGDRTTAYIGGFIALTSQYYNISKWVNCYYDKQTTAMREWVAGDVNTSTGSTVNGVTGVLTSTSNKAGIGLASGEYNTDEDDDTADFKGFENDYGSNKWHYENDYYPQLTVFYNASTDDWGDEETVALVKAYSLASASTVILDTWDTGYTWDENGVRSTNEEAYNSTGLGDDYEGDYYTYDTVRDIISLFTVTGASTYTYMVNGTSGAITQVTTTTETQHITNSEATTTTKTGGDIVIYNDIDSGTVDSPGMEWFEISATSKYTDDDDGEVTVAGSRPIRLIGYMSVDAGEDETVKIGTTYDHRDDVTLTMMDSLTDNLVVGLHDSYAWATALQGGYPDSDYYYFVETDNMVTEFSASQGAIINTEIWEAVKGTVNDQNLTVFVDSVQGITYYCSDTSSGYVYYYADDSSDAIYKEATFYTDEDGDIYMQTYSVKVTGEGTGAEELADRTVAEKEWIGETAFVTTTSQTEDTYYIVSYYWMLTDGRYVTDYKVITIEPNSAHNISIQVLTYETGEMTDTLNDTALYLGTGITDTGYVYSGDDKDKEYGLDTSTASSASTTEIQAGYDTAVGWKKAVLSGEETSSVKIKKIMVEIVADNDPSTLYSDDSYAYVTYTIDDSAELDLMDRLEEDEYGNAEGISFIIPVTFYTTGLEDDSTQGQYRETVTEKKVEAIYTVTVEDDGSYRIAFDYDYGASDSTITDTSDLVASIRVTIWVARGEIEIYKYDGDEGLEITDTSVNGTFLPDTEFALYAKSDVEIDSDGNLTVKDGATKLGVTTTTDDDSTVTIEELTTDEDGNITVRDLTSGTYYLIETTAPAGYMILNKYWVLEVDALTETFTVNNGNYYDTVYYFYQDGSKVYVTDEYLSSFSYSGGLTLANATIGTLKTATGKTIYTEYYIPNYKVYTLPSTGVDGDPVMLLTAGGSALMLLAAWLWVRRREVAFMYSVRDHGTAPPGR